MNSKAGGSHFDYNGTGELPIHESGLRPHDARRSFPNLMSASTSSKSILRIDDDLMAGSRRQVLRSESFRTPALAKSAAGGKIAALLAQKQPTPFLSQFLVELPYSIETSIKGQTL
jgi:hypothetical protein